MTIREAALAANRQGKSMARRSWPQGHRRMMATNTTACIIGIPEKRSAPILREWRPTLNDLVATDWYISG